MNKELEALKRVSGLFIDHTSYEEDLKLLEQALTLPKADEVCEAIYLHFRNKYRYLTKVIKRNNKFILCFESGGFVNVLDYIRELTSEAPHLIILIGKFYEGEVKNE